MYSNMNVEDLMTAHVEKISHLRKALCCDCSDDDPSFIEIDRIEELSNMAQELVLHLETVATLQNLVQALNQCPECGCNLKAYRRPVVKR